MEQKDISKQKPTGWLQRFKSGIQKYRRFKKETADKKWFCIFNMICNILLAILTVLPMLGMVVSKVPFSYEVNDDATIVQILDGSFTGTPEAHGIFIKYPLSWIMSSLFEKNPSIDVNRFLAGLFRLSQTHFENVNWYLGVIIIIEAFAMTVVLFRMLDYFGQNRIMICALFDLGFLIIWLSCFSALTFSTAAAFCGSMTLLYTAFTEGEKFWRPWNLAVFGVLLTGTFCLRTNCFYMILPFLCVELLWKYHITFLRSPKPWIAAAFFGILSGALLYGNTVMYSSQQWKQYKIYNHARAYLQDYTGFPDYEDNAAFFDSLGMNKMQRDAMAKYSYCLVDDFDIRWVEKTYEYQKSMEKTQSIREKIKEAEPVAKKYWDEKKQAPFELRFYARYIWVLLIPLAILTVVFHLRKENIPIHIWNILCFDAMALLLRAEWIYLAMNGRFPARVEESIRLVTLTVGIMAAGHFLRQWKENRLTAIPVLVQLLLVACLFRIGIGQEQIEQTAGRQKYHLTYASEKAEILSYCGEHPENLYVLDTRSFTKMSRPGDDTHQGNWFMSGSWTAYTPLYFEKLSSCGISGLGSEFLTKKNVYVITKGKKNIAALMGIEDREKVETEIADEIVTGGNNFFEIYKVKRVK